MAIQRTRKEKENPHYSFLYSWKPTEPHVKREKKFSQNASVSMPENPKMANKAESQAKEPQARNIKKDIVRSLIVISLILALEVVVYLAWNKFVLL